MEFLENVEYIKEQKLFEERRATGMTADLITRVGFKFNKDNIQYRDEVLDYICKSWKVEDGTTQTTDYDFWLWYSDNDKYYFEISPNKKLSVEESAELLKNFKAKIQEQFLDKNVRCCALWTTEYNYDMIESYIMSNTEETLLKNIDKIKPLFELRFCIGCKLSEECIRKLEIIKTIYLQSLLNKPVTFYGVPGKIIRAENGDFAFRKKRARNYVYIYSNDLVKIKEV